jgi:hypothetical protein
MVVKEVREGVEEKCLIQELRSINTDASQLMMALPGKHITN